MKKIKLRAFEINQTRLSKPNSQAVNLLKQKLDNSQSSNDRRMLLNDGDPKKEEDLIAHFNTSNKNIIFATMLRIAPKSNVQHISEELFQRNNFSISDLLDIKLKTSAIYVDHYYFVMTDRFVVTNLSGRYTIMRLQTYLNYLLGELLELSPVIEVKEEYELGSIKSFVIQDPKNYNKSNIETSSKDNQVNTGIISKFQDITHLAGGLLKEFFNASSELNEIDLNQLISAKLVIQLKKVTKNTPDEVKKAFSAVLKPMSDLDNIAFKTRAGTSVTGSQLVKCKQIDIDTTKTGEINEQSLFQQMEIFIQELENA